MLLRPTDLQQFGGGDIQLCSGGLRVNHADGDAILQRLPQILGRGARGDIKLDGFADLAGNSKPHGVRLRA